MKRGLLYLIALLFLVCLAASYSRAQISLPGEPNWVAARFPANPTAVTVDVLEIGGAQLADNIAATQQQLDALDTDVWAINLAALAGYPLDCEPRTYVVRFNPDAADCTDVGDPLACVEDLVRVGGATCEGDPGLQVSYTYANTSVALQGITQAVIDHFNLRGGRPVRWRRIDQAADRDFTTPDFTKWEVYFYQATAVPFPRLTCTVETETDPSVTLPSSTDCAGN